jgi:signal peptidase I
LVNKLAYRFGEPDHGDVVIFHYPANPQEDYIKRVIGVPGDEILIQDGRVTVNGTELNEPYISAPPTYRGSWIVPENQIFVLGDNRNQSSDSHSWGFVPFENLVGKALVVYWPVDQIKTLTHPLSVNLPEVVNAAHE